MRVRRKRVPRHAIAAVAPPPRDRARDEDADLYAFWLQSLGLLALRADGFDFENSWLAVEKNHFRHLPTDSCFNTYFAKNAFLF